MTINYNVTGTERKRLADYISGFMGTEKKYLGAPTFAYQIGYLTVRKDSAVSFENRGYNSDIDALMAELEGQGFHTEDAIAKADIAEPEATSGEALPMEVSPDIVSFPWFVGRNFDTDKAKTYTHLIAALCNMAQNQKRITAREKATDNDKYAFRCFLLRLGFIGPNSRTSGKSCSAASPATARSSLAAERRRRIMRFPHRETVERIRREYPVGCWVELLRMDDPQTPPIGTRGAVRGVDDSGSIMVAWDSGGSLHVLFGVDECCIIERDGT